VFNQSRAKIVKKLALIITGLLLLPSIADASRADYKTTYNYAVRFYPRLLSYIQLTGTNRLIGPAGMGPEYKAVVAINVDTLYASATLDLSKGPLVLTVPAYQNTYSILQLDLFGNIFSNQLAPNTAGGVYSLIPPGYKGDIPAGTTAVQMPYTSVELIFRADKYTADGQDVSDQANDFRTNLQLQTVEAHNLDPNAGKTRLVPLYELSTSFKQMVDEGFAVSTTQTLEVMQEAMAASSTVPLTKNDKQLIKNFNNRFNAAKTSANASGERLSDIIQGAQAAHKAIIDRWHSNVDEHYWIHFDNVGHWGKSYLDRAALNEYIQWGNDAQAAYYGHAFKDGDGLSLDGGEFSYAIHFTKDQIPQAKRFWSITAYTPEDIELVENSLEKYNVASYTPGLVTDAEGGVTIRLQANPPKNAPQANWLPIPNGPFNVMLRVYGPEGSAADGTYLPPKSSRLPYEF
jgi:hypothetical protein